MSGSDRQWHLDKRVPIAIIFAIMAQTASVAWWAARLDSRVGVLEREVAAREQFQERLVIVETKIHELSAGQRRIEAKLDRLLDDRR